MSRKKIILPTTAAPVQSYKHEGKRLRIPTQEESSMLTPREKQPVKKKYEYDPSLDPQLEWSGKKEQVSEFAVSTVPIYVQEKITPEALIARLKLGAEDNSQMMLFGETAEMQFGKALDFYRHEDNWQNRLILGDSLLVMNSLLEKEGMRGRIQTIYIDPPYGIKFGSNWQVSTRKKDVKDNRLEDFIRQPEQVKAFRDTWELGIHSYLSYMRDRLLVARELLTESGSCFVQISDENVHLIRNLMDEVFGSDNMISLIPFAKTSGFSPVYLSNVCDYIIWYAKDKKSTKYRQLYKEKSEGRGFAVYQWVELPDKTRRKLTKEEKENSEILPKGSKIFRLSDIISQGATNSEQKFTFKGKDYYPRPGTHWTTSVKGLERLSDLNRIMLSASRPYFVRYLDDYPVTPLSNFWDDTATGSFTEEKIYLQSERQTSANCL